MHPSRPVLAASCVVLFLFAAACDGGTDGGGDAPADAGSGDADANAGGGEGEGEGGGEGEGEGEGGGGVRFGSCEQAFSCKPADGGALVVIKLKCDKDAATMACTCLEAGAEVADCRDPQICQARRDASDREDDGREQAMLDVFNGCCGTDHALTENLLQEPGCSPTAGGEHVLP